MITKKTHEDWQHLATGDPWDTAIKPDVVAAVRALTDWTADILTVMRAVAVYIPAVGDSATGSLFWHAERVHAGLATLVTGGTASTDLNPGLLTTWGQMPGENPRKALTYLADEFGYLLYVLNAVSGASELRGVASSSEGMPYWHAERAHVAVLTLLTGSAEDGQALHDHWSGNQEDTTWNLKLLAEDKRARSVVVTVAADGDTAKFLMPDGTEQDGGHMGEPAGVLWGTDESGDVVAHGSCWSEVATKLIEHGGYGVDTPVIVEYAADQA